MEFRKSENFIEVIGHFDNEVLCAKMTLLAELYAVEHKSGYAKFKIEDEDKLKAINDNLEFIQACNFYGLGLTTSIYILKDGGIFGDGTTDIGTLATTQTSSSSTYVNDYTVFSISSTNNTFTQPDIKLSDTQETGITKLTDYTFKVSGLNSVRLAVESAGSSAKQVRLKNASNEVLHPETEFSLVQNVPTATTSQLGVVKVDGSTITIDGNGVLSASGGGSQLYLHNIYINLQDEVYSSSYKRYGNIKVQIINQSATQMTYATLKTFLDNNGFNSSSSFYQVSGTALNYDYSGSNSIMFNVIGIYYQSGFGGKIMLHGLAGVNFNASTSALSNVGFVSDLECTAIGVDFNDTVIAL